MTPLARLLWVMVVLLSESGRPFASKVFASSEYAFWYGVQEDVVFLKLMAPTVSS